MSSIVTMNRCELGLTVAKCVMKSTEGVRVSSDGDSFSSDGDSFCSEDSEDSELISSDSVCSGVF